MWLNLIYNNEKYENFVINEFGQVRNIKTNHIYKNKTDKQGYIILTLPMGKRGKVKSIRLHKALAETFIPNPNKYNIVHHKDDNKSNYSLDNLEWVSSKINKSYHLQKLKKDTSLFNNRKLTKNDIDFIRNNKNNFSYNQLAKQFNVSKTTIVNVVNNKLYNNGLW